MIERIKMFLQIMLMVIFVIAVIVGNKEIIFVTGSVIIFYPMYEKYH